MIFEISLAAVCVIVLVGILIKRKKLKKILCDINKDNQIVQERLITDEDKSVCTIADNNRVLELEANRTIDSSKAVNKSEYMRKYGLIKNEGTLPYTIVVYYNGYPDIDSKGILCTKKFYMWIDCDMLNLLDTNIVNSIGAFKFPLKELRYFKSLEDEVTIIDFSSDKDKRYIFLDKNAYEFLSTHI